MRQRQILERAMDRQRRAYITREDIASSGSEEVNIEEENKEKIDFLLKNTLAPKKFNKKYGEKDGLTCTICIENFRVGKSRVCITPCQHVFHYKCLSNWLRNKDTTYKCPVCNCNILEYQNNHFSDDKNPQFVNNNDNISDNNNNLGEIMSLRGRSRENQTNNNH